MKKNKKAMRDSGRGFTLIELLVTIAIISILAAVVLVSMTSYAKRARSSKALAQLSSAIPSMISCWGNGGKVNGPLSGGQICDIGLSYGTWPKVGSGDLFSYSYYSNASGGFLTKGSWWVSMDSNASNDDKKICCNSEMNSCIILDTFASSCDLSTN